MSNQLIHGRMKAIIATDEQSALAQLGVFLRTERGFDALKEHLSKEFAVEGLLFWAEADEFEHDFCDITPELITPEITDTMQQSAISIYRTYLEPGAPMELNLSFEMMDQFRYELFAFVEPVNRRRRRFQFDRSYNNRGSKMIPKLFSPKNLAQQMKNWPVRSPKQGPPTSAEEPNVPIETAPQMNTSIEPATTDNTTNAAATSPDEVVQEPPAWDYLASVERKAYHADPHVFAAAAQEVLLMLLQDSVQRFRNNPKYAVIWDEVLRSCDLSEISRNTQPRGKAASIVSIKSIAAEQKPNYSKM